MPGPAPAVAAVRRAVRDVIRQIPSGATVLVACSGGPDSLALAAGLAFEGPKAGLRAGALVVDHALQPGSAAVADAAGAACATLGLDPVEVIRVEVSPGRSGVEDAARQARYAALEAAAGRHTAALVLLGHTRDDQAEQVLLGLARGSGARSLSGMPPARGPFARPLLGVSRAQTEAACAALGLTAWRDPHNADPAYARVRARQAIGVLEQALGPGLAASLARSATLLRDDAGLLDELASQARARVTGPAEDSAPNGFVGPPGGPLRVSGTRVSAIELAALHPALRRRIWRILAAEAGARALTAVHLDLLDGLVTRWRGQGPVDLPGQVMAARSAGVLSLHRAPPG